MQIDLTPLIDQVLMPCLSAVLLAAVTWAATRVAALAHFQINDGQRKLLMSAVDNAISFAEQKIGQQTVTVDQRVATAVNYLLPKVPGTLQALKITPDHLGEIVTARLPK